jgi:O-antigen ligase
VALLAFICVLFVLQGRTGQVIALAYLCGYVVWGVIACYRSRNRLGWGCCVAGLAVCAAVLLLFSNPRYSRMADIIPEIRQAALTKQETSSGARVAFYQQSVALIAARPFLGFGAGGIARPMGTPAGVTERSGNPHNEFLLMGVQLGMAGIGLLIWLFTAVAMASRQLERTSRLVMHGLLAATVIGSLFNSMLLNFTEGHLFVLFTGIVLYGGLGRADMPPAPSSR